MIDTVFYFAPSLEEYQSQWQNGDISQRTIVFVPPKNVNNGEAGTIYKGGVAYGNATDSNIERIVEEMLANYVPNWPKATKNSLGGVIVGDYLNVDSNGKVGVNTDDLFNADTIKNKIKNIINAAYIKGIIDENYIKQFISSDPQTGEYVLPAASTSTRGGIKVGKNLTISDTDKLNVNTQGIISDLEESNQFEQWLRSLGLSNADIQPASTTTLGGIKLHDPNTPLGNREYAVKLNGDNKAYVYVPWEKGEGGEEDPTTKMQRTFFLNVEHDTVPELPLTSDYDGQSKSFIDTRNNVTWTYNNTNPTGTQDTYQIWAWIVGNTAMSVDGPIKVRDGVEGGQNGEDGKEREYIYKQMNTLADQNDLRDWATQLAACKGNAAAKWRNPETDEYVTDGITFKHEDAVPMDWEDRAHGISSTSRYEYRAMRVSSLNENKERVWGDTGFTAPVLISSWGEKGEDGDGVQFIFCISTSTPLDNPSTWTNDEGFQDRDGEYIRPGSTWVDDIDTLRELNPGEKIYVSIRKQKDDVWQPYSNPMVWATIPIAEGAIVDGLIIESHNDQMTVFLGSEGGGIASDLDFEESAHIDLYNGFTPISTFSLDANNIEYSYPANRPHIFDQNECGDVTINGHDITVYIDSAQYASTVHNTQGYTTGDTIIIKIPITNITVNNGSAEDRYVYLYLTFAKVGMDGYSYRLSTSAPVIKKTISGAVSHNLTVEAVATQGKSNIHKAGFSTGTGVFSGFSMYYRIDDDEQWRLLQQTGNAYGFSSSALTAVQNQIIIKLVYNDGTNDIIVDQETIHVVSDGIGQSAVTYNITPTASTILKSGEDNISGTITFKVNRVEGSTVSNINANALADIGKLVVIYNDTTLGESGTSKVQYDNHVWTFSATMNDTIPYSAPVIVIVLYDTNDYVLATAIVPVVVNGTNEVTQSLEAVVSRTSVWNENGYNKNGSYVSYNNGQVVESDGIKYLDIVVYGNSLFYCDDITTANNNAPYDDVNKRVNAGWVMFNNTLAEYINVLVARYADIENLTARNIVVTNSNNDIVGGMTSGNAIPTSLENTQNVDSVRIWAGPISNGDLMQTPFHVTNAGKLTAAGATISGDITATSFNVVDSNNNTTIEFTTFTNNLATNYPNILSLTPDLVEGDPVGLVYSGGQLKYFFEFAPVKVLNFSAEDEVFYNISGATSRVTLQVGPTYFYVTSQGSNYHKYIKTPSTNGTIVNNQDSLWEKGRSHTAFIDRSPNGHYMYQVVLFREVIFVDGVKQYTGKVRLLDSGISGSNIQSYKPSDATHTVRKDSIYSYGNESTINVPLYADTYEVHTLIEGVTNNTYTEDNTNPFVVGILESHSSGQNNGITDRNLLDPNLETYQNS